MTLEQWLRDHRDLTGATISTDVDDRGLVLKITLPNPVYVEGVFVVKDNECKLWGY